MEAADAWWIHEYDGAESIRINEQVSLRRGTAWPGAVAVMLGATFVGDIGVAEPAFIPYGGQTIHGQ